MSQRGVDVYVNSCIKRVGIASTKFDKFSSQLWSPETHICILLPLRGIMK